MRERLGKRIIRINNTTCSPGSAEAITGCPLACACWSRGDLVSHHNKGSHRMFDKCEGGPSLRRS